MYIDSIDGNEAIDGSIYTLEEVKHDTTTYTARQLAISPNGYGSKNYPPYCKVAAAPSSFQAKYAVVDYVCTCYCILYYLSVFSNIGKCYCLQEL